MNVLSNVYSKTIVKQSSYKNLKPKGALFIEYAMLLAFVVCLGVLFINNDSGFIIGKIFTRNGAVLDRAINNSVEAIRDKVSLHMVDAIDVALHKVEEKYPGKLFDYLDSNGTQVGLQKGADGKANMEIKNEIEKNIRDFLVSKGMFSEDLDLIYWTIDRHDKKATDNGGEFHGYRFAWSTCNPNDYNTQDYMPVIQYTRHDNPAEKITNCHDSSGAAHWEFQVGAKYIETANGINKIKWDNQATKDKYVVTTEQDALDRYNAIASQYPSSKNK